MDTARLWRIIKARWWIIAILSAVGVLAAFVGSNARNNAITPVFQAEAPVTVFPNQTEIIDPKGQILDSVLQQLDNAQTLALGSNASFLELHPDAAVRSDANLGRLTFVARAETAEAAQALASQMRENYLQEEPFNLQQQLADQLDEVTSRLTEVREKLTGLDVPSETQTKADDERLRLTSLLSSLRSRQNSLEQELLFSPLTTLPPDAEPFRTEEDIQAELEAVRGYINTYTSQLEALPPVEDQYSERETLRRALQREYREMEVDYQDLLLQQDQATGPAVVEVIEVIDQTPAEAPVGTASGIGLIIGVVLGMFGLSLADRIKRPLWSATDAKPFTLLGEIPARRRRVTDLWYELQDAGTPRKESLQGLRAAVESRIGERRVVIGIAGVSTDATVVHEFVGDLAVSLAATDHSVLLLDADFASPGTNAEFGDDEKSLSDLLEEVAGTEAELRAVLESLPSPLPGLRPLRAGAGPADPIDAVAGLRFRALLDACWETAEVTLLALPSTDSPLTMTVLERLDHAIIATTRGVSPIPGLQRVADEMAAGTTSVLGVVMLGRRSQIRDRLRSALFDHTAPDRADQTGGGAPTESPTAPLSVHQEPVLSVEPPDLLQPEEAFSPPSPGEIDRLVPEDAGDTDLIDEQWRLPGSVPTMSQKLPDLSSIEFGAGDATSESVGEADDEDTSATEEAPPATADVADAEEDGAQDKAVEKVLGLLRDRIERILTGSIGDEALRSEILPILEHQGFIPIVRVRKQKTLGDLVRTSLRQELEPSKQRVFEQSLREVLKRQLGVDQSNLVDLINEWTAARFFADEVSLKEIPALWHLTSSQGAFQALVYSRLCDRQRLEALLKDLASVRIDMLVRRARRARRAGESKKEARLEAEAEDVRDFRATVKDLLEGTSPEARLFYPARSGSKELEGWDPDFSQDLRQTLAPIERLGLLPIEVLGAEGLAQLSAFSE